MEELRQIIYGSKPIDYILTRKNVKNINIKIKADGQVCVSANSLISAEIIDDFVKSKCKWLVKHQKSFEDMRREIPPREYVSGEDYMYLGSHYRLRVQKAKEETVEISGDYIIIAVKNTENFSRKQNLLRAWYNDQVKKVFQEVFDKTIEGQKSFFGNQYTLKHITMVARWGSCVTNKNTVILNSKLIFAPKYCIEYVVLHELIHFKCKNHNKEFYLLLDNLMPDWKERKRILDEEIILYCRGNII